MDSLDLDLDLDLDVDVDVDFRSPWSCMPVRWFAQLVLAEAVRRHGAEAWDAVRTELAERAKDVARYVLCYMFAYVCRTS